MVANDAVSALDVLGLRIEQLWLDSQYIARTVDANGIPEWGAHSDPSHPLRVEWPWFHGARGVDNPDCYTCWAEGDHLVKMAMHPLRGDDLQNGCFRIGYSTDKNGNADHGIQYWATQQFIDQTNDHELGHMNDFRTAHDVTLHHFTRMQNIFGQVKPIQINVSSLSRQTTEFAESVCKYRLLREIIEKGGQTQINFWARLFL